MKKYFSLVLVLVMALSLAACGSKKEPTPTPKKAEATSLTTDGITIEGNYGEATKVTTKTKDLSEYAALDAYLADKLTGSVVYDITIKDKNGKAVQPDGKVNVTVDTEGIADKNSDYVVYYVDDKGAFEKVDVVASTAKSVTFKTTHFSVYAVCVYDASKHSDNDFLKTSKEVEAEAAKAAENTENPAENTESSEATNAPAFTYTDMSATLYAQQTVNVRDLPDTSGNKIGSLKTNDEIVVSGQCNETGWYRISYGGGVAYVSNSYVSSEKVAVQQPKNETAASQQSAGNNGGSASASAGAPSGNHVALSDAQAFFESHGWAHAYMEGNSVITYTAVVSGGGVFEPAGMENEFLSYTMGRNYQGNGPITYVWEDNSAPNGCLVIVERHEFPLLD